MKKLFAIMMALCMLMTAFVGCATTADPAAPAAKPAEGTASAAAPAEDKTLELAINMALSTVDPHSNRAVQDLIVLNQVYESLFFYDDLNGDYEPRIADSYELSPDGTVYTFKLNPAVKFHNGDAVKASDVVWSIQRAATNGSTAALLTDLVEAEEIDEATVALTIKAPNAAFMSNLANIFVISQKEVEAQGAEFGTKLFLGGTGPYYFTSLDQDVEWTLEAFPEYYRGEAAIKKIHYRPITDASAALMSLQAGELSYLQLSSVADFGTLQANSAFNTESIAANHITFLCVEANVEGPLSNKLVRQAIAYAVNKDEMNIAGFNGLATVATHMENPTYNACAPDGGIVYEYNPEKAKQLLAEAGYADGVDIGKMLTFPGSHFEKCAQVAQANLAAVGIKVELEMNEQATAIARWNAPGDFMITVPGYPSTGDYDSFRLRFDYRSSSAFSDFASSPFDTKTWADLIDKAAQESDPEKRTAIHQELNDLIMEEAIFIPLLHKAVPCAWVNDLSVVNRPNYYYVYEWAWN